jgi:hypothetical protein
MVNQLAVDIGPQTFSKLFLTHFTAQDMDLLSTKAEMNRKCQEWNTGSFPRAGQGGAAA